MEDSAVSIIFYFTMLFCCYTIEFQFISFLCVPHCNFVVVGSWIFFFLASALSYFVPQLAFVTLPDIDKTNKNTNSNDKALLLIILLIITLTL